jgi:hypothetical protein
MAPDVYIRVKKEDGLSYSLRVYDYLNPDAIKCPELMSFNPEYGSATIYENDRIIKFNFKPQ